MQSIQEIDGDLGRVKWSDIYEDPVETRRDQRNANLDKFLLVRGTAI